MDREQIREKQLKLELSKLLFKNINGYKLMMMNCNWFINVLFRDEATM